MATREIHKVLLVHPSSLMYSEVYLRLEPLGLELVAAACRKADYDVRLIDLQANKPKDYFRLLDDWHPDAIGYSLNYLASIPATKTLLLSGEDGAGPRFKKCRRTVLSMFRNDCAFFCHETVKNNLFAALCRTIHFLCRS
jgi:B12 binding protein